MTKDEKEWRIIAEKMGANAASVVEIETARVAFYDELIKKELARLKKAGTLEKTLKRMCRPS